MGTGVLLGWGARVESALVNAKDLLNLISLWTRSQRTGFPGSWNTPWAV